MSAIEREARRDAREFARAQMFYGEGAGVRRKLITAKVEGKVAQSEAYGRAFHSELARQDMAEHAAKARREREFKDKSQSLNKNVRGLASGNYQNVNTSILVIAAIAYFSHQTGLDKKVYEKGRAVADKIKTRVRSHKAKKGKIFNITSVK